MTAIGAIYPSNISRGTVDYLSLPRKQLVMRFLCKLLLILCQGAWPMSLYLCVHVCQNVETRAACDLQLISWFIYFSNASVWLSRKPAVIRTETDIRDVFGRTASSRASNVSSVERRSYWVTRESRTSVGQSCYCRTARELQQTWSNKNGMPNDSGDGEVFRLASCGSPCGQCVASRCLKNVA